MYVAGTYLGNHPTPDGTLLAECMHWIADATALVLAAIVWSEYFFGVAFSLDYLLHLFIAENKMVYVFSWGAAVDLLAIFPVFAVGTETSIGFLVSAVLCCARRTCATAHASSQRVFRVFRVLRILRGYRMFAAGDSSEAGVSRQIAILVLCSSRSAQLAAPQLAVSPQIFYVVSFVFVTSGFAHRYVSSQLHGR